MEYKNIEKTSDKQYLYNNLSGEKLKEIDDILGAYFSGKINFIVPRLENGEPDFCGEFKLIINDDTYEKTGNELLVLRWVEDYEDTGYMVDCIKD